MDVLYITEIMRNKWLQTLDEYWYEEDTPYSYDFGSWPEWQFQYYNEVTLDKDIESACLVWKSEQHKLTHKYAILRSLVPLINHYFVTMEEDDKQFK